MAKGKGKKELEVDIKSLKTVASDAISDVVYSLLTDIFNKLSNDDLLTDVDRAVDIVNSVAEDVGFEGIRLRRANIERRNNARKERASGKTKREQKAVKWIIHPKDKRMEYTKDIEIGKRYVLRKIGTNKV